MKVYYFNDETKDVLVRIMDSRYNGVTCTGDIFVTLKPTTGQEFDVDLPANKVLFIKKWDHQVMISYSDSTTLPEQTQQLQEKLSKDLS